jgi:hypothetical protein
LLELSRLLQERVHEVLREDLREARHVEDVLLGVQSGELAASLGKCVDDLRGGPAHASVEEGEEPDRSGADDRQVPDLMGLHLIKFATPRVPDNGRARPSSPPR